MHEILKLIVSILICQMPGVLGSLFTMPAVRDWYGTLNRPSFAPPNWVFGPVWLTLYTMMGISLFLIWRQEGQNREVKTALFMFVINLVLNALWSFLFFGLRSPIAGLVEIVLLLASTVACIIFFARISRGAAVLLVPYALWVAFAAILNGGFYILNRQS